LLASLFVAVVTICQFGGGADHCATLVLSPTTGNGAGAADEPGGCCEDQSCPEAHLGACCQPMPGLAVAGSAEIAESTFLVVSVEFARLTAREYESCLFRPPAA